LKFTFGQLFGFGNMKQDEHLDVIYTNEKVNLEEWRMFEVGKTNCNDQAIKQRSSLSP